MYKLSRPADVTLLLKQYDIRLRKKWGQNFLVDENILQKIVAAAALTKEDSVVEIGPGIGALTEKLAQSALRVTAFEIDERLLPVLQQTLADYDNVAIIHADALRIDYRRFCQYEKVKVVANLPYNVATPLFYKWLKDLRSCFSLFVCMVQKEVACRIAAEPGSKDYGTLSVICQYAAHCDIAFDVPSTVFIPRPDVASAVVKLLPREYTALSAAEESLFYQVVEAVFSQRRKTMLNTLNSMLGISKPILQGLAEQVAIDPARRGETLTIEEFVCLTKSIHRAL